jgi:hypothetical protein
VVNMELTAVTHDNISLGKGGRKGGVNKPETFSKTCVSVTQHEGKSPWCCQFGVAEIASAGHVSLCWETISTREDEHYIHINRVCTCECVYTLMY